METVYFQCFRLIGSDLEKLGVGKTGSASIYQRAVESFVEQGVKIKHKPGSGQEVTQSDEVAEIEHKQMIGAGSVDHFHIIRIVGVENHGMNVYRVDPLLETQKIGNPERNACITELNDNPIGCIALIGDAFRGGKQFDGLTGIRHGRFQKRYGLELATSDFNSVKIQSEC